MIIQYVGYLYPDVIESYNESGASISAMAKSLKSWKWPSTKDELFYEWKDIIGGIDPPKLLNKRVFFHVPEMSRTVQ